MAQWLPQHVRDGDLPRHCTKCERLKPASEFHKRPGGRRRECKTCWHAIHKARDQGPANRAKHRWRERHKDKYAAHSAVSNALRDGKLTRPDHCEKCNIECKPHGHHEDYSKPLEVMWLCVPCHKLEHSHD